MYLRSNYFASSCDPRWSAAVLFWRQSEPHWVGANNLTDARLLLLRSLLYHLVLLLVSYFSSPTSRLLLQSPCSPSLPLNSLKMPLLLLVCCSDLESSVPHHLVLLLFLETFPKIRDGDLGHQRQLNTITIPGTALNIVTVPRRWGYCSMKDALTTWKQERLRWSFSKRWQSWASVATLSETLDDNFQATSCLSHLSSQCPRPLLSRHFPRPYLSNQSSWPLQERSLR